MEVAHFDDMVILTQTNVLLQARRNHENLRTEIEKKHSQNFSFLKKKYRISNQLVPIN